MAETGAKLSLVPRDRDSWTVAHALPGRLRIRAPALADPAGCAAFRQVVLAHPAVSSVAVTPRIASATVYYSARLLPRKELDALLHSGLVSPSSAAPVPVGGSEDVSRDGHLALLLAGLAATPLLPLPARYVVTAAAISPTIWQALSHLRGGGAASRSLDALALALSTVAGRYGVAQVNNLMHVLGQKLERQAVAETENELRRHATPPAALYRVSRDGESLECDPLGLRSGDRIALVADQVVPLEAVVLGGRASISNGFSGDPVDVYPGARVAAGSQLLDGELDLACLQDWSQGHYACMAGFIEIAIRNRESHEDYAANLADRLVPITVLISAAVYGFTRDLARASSAMQVDFGAASELITPVSVESTIAAGAGSGILFRGGGALERLAELDTLVFDRSGTLTGGEWRLTDLYPVGEFDEARCRDLISQLVNACCRPGVILASPEYLPPVVTVSHAEMQEIRQYGLHMRLSGRAVGLTDVASAVGRFGIAPPATMREAAGVAQLCLMVDGTCVGIVHCSDPLSPGNIEAVSALREQGIGQLYLVSQERADALHPELAELPLDGIYTELSELEKLDFIQDLLDQGRRVGLVSDGLFRAGRDCLNLCLGTVPEARPLDADVWLMRGDNRGLAAAHRLAKHSTARLRRGHRSSHASKGAMLLASSFDLLPPGLAAALGNSVTLGMMRYARTTTTGEGS